MNIKNYTSEVDATCHFRFLDPDLWGKLNQHISRIKGYPLFEYKAKGKREAQKFKKQQAGFAA